MKDTFGTTNNGNTPIAAILFCSTFSLLAFLGLCDPTFNQVSPKKNLSYPHKRDLPSHSQFSLSPHSSLAHSAASTEANASPFSVSSLGELSTSSPLPKNSTAHFPLQINTTSSRRPRPRLPRVSEKALPRALAAPLRNLRTLWLHNDGVI